MLLLSLIARQTTRFQVHVICLDETGELADKVRGRGALVHEINGLASSPVLKALRLIRALRAVRPDIIHTHNLSPHFYAILAYPFVRPALFVHTRHGRHLREGTLAGLVNRLSARWTSRVIAVSRDVADLVTRTERFPSDKVIIVQNAVDVDAYTRAAGSALSAVTVGRLVAEKDHETLLRAVSRVVARHPQFKVSVVGTGAEAGVLEGICRSLSLGRNVRFFGARNDIPQILAQHGLFVISSTSEGVPLALLEAMASALPIVSTSVGGIPEVIQDGVTGLLVAPQDPAALAAAICRLVEEPGLAQKLGQAALERVRSGHSLGGLTETYDAIYDDVIAHRGGK